MIVGDKSGVMEVSTNDKLSSTVRLFVAKNFNADISKTLNLKENKFKIYSVFTVNTKGEVEDIKIRAPHPELEKETERVLTLLPILVPASKDGKYVAMKYTLPISSNNGFNKLNPKKEEGNYIPLAIIEHPPVFPGCKGTREQKIKCLNTGIQKHVLKNFNIDVSKNIGLTSGKKKVYVVFKIDENGDIVDVNARAPHLTLKEEAIRVAKTLPKMIAGKQRGISVGVKYTLPITFNIE